MADIPFLSGYRAREEQIRRQEHGDLANFGALEKILAAVQQRELMKQFAGSMAGGGAGGTPEQLDAMAMKLAAQGHPGAAALSALADKRRTAATVATDAATQMQAIRSPAPAPIQSAPPDAGLKMVADTGAQPMIHGTNWTNPSAAQVPPEERAAFDNVLNDARAKNATARGEGGQFAGLMESEIPSIAARAKQMQQMANASPATPAAVAHWQRAYESLAKENTALLERRSAVEAANTRRTETPQRVPIGYRMRPDGNLERIPVVGGGKTSEDALTNDAWFQIINGKARPGSLPLGRDEGNKYREQVRERIATIASDLGLSPERLATLGPENKAKFGALAAVEKDLAAIRPFDDMLERNAKIAIDLAKKISGDRTNSQFINKPITWLENNAADNPDIAEYLFQIQTVKTEGARILNNPRLVGQLTDSARGEMGMVVNGNMPLGQTERVLGRMLQDGKNRVSAIEKESERLRADIRGSAGVQTPAPATPQPAAAPAVSIEDRLKKYK